MIPGLILAAGAATRMGRPKALLAHPATGMTFVATLVHALRDGGIDDVAVVGRIGDDALVAEVETIAAGRPSPRYIENPHAERGQLESLLVGLNAVDRPGVTGLLVTPVDAASITGMVVARLLDAFRTSRAPIVRAAHRDRHGHPVIFGRAMFDELRRADPAAGARSVVRAHAGDVVNVEFDAAVLSDIDTPADYERLCAGRARST